MKTHTYESQHMVGTPMCVNCEEYQEEIKQDKASCEFCPLNKVCAVYISAIKTVKGLEASFGKEGEIPILDEIAWKPEDLAKGCKYKPKPQEFGV